MTPPERSGGPPAASAAPAGPAAAPPTPPWRRPRAALLGTAAWGLALTALSLTQAEPGRTWAVLLLGLAGLGAAVAGAWAAWPLSPGRAAWAPSPIRSTLLTPPASSASPARSGWPPWAC